MESEKLQVVFTSEPVFEPGAVIAGFVLLHLAEPMKARAVKIVVKGVAYTHWTEDESYSTTNSDGTSTTKWRSVSYSATVVIAASENILWRGTDSAEYLPVGEHSYPFQFMLPINSPPSHEATSGSIRYKCKAIIDRPWRFDTKVNGRFQVRPAPLHPSLDFPAMTDASKELGMVLFRHGYLSVEVTIPKQGFVPGEDLSVQILVKNSSTRDVEYLTVYLKKYSLYIAHRNGGTFTLGESCGGGRTRSKKEVIVTLREGISVKKESEGCLDRCLPIPAAEPSLDASIIQVKLTAHGNVSNHLKASMPIIIGATRQRGADLPVPAYAAVEPSAPTEAPPPYEAQPFVYPPQYPQL